MMKTVFGEWSQAPNGLLVLQLSKYALIGGTAKNAPRFYRIRLDANGGIPAGQQIVANDQIMPEGTQYQATVYDSNSNILFGPQMITICGPDPINLNQVIVVSTTPPPQVSLTISPTTATLQPGHTQQFTYTVANTPNHAVTWATTLGTITAGGLYTAPMVTTSTAVTVAVTSVVDPTKSASAFLTIDPLPAVTISPGSASLQPGQTQQFTSNMSVNWSSSDGQISSTGSYTAPSVTAATTVTVTATSVTDATNKASVSVSIQPVAQISVTIAPTGGTVTAGGTMQFSHVVNNSVNQTVTWTASLGSITSAGLYSAPATVASATTATITATSAADTTKSASVTITLQPPTGPQAIDLLTWMPLNQRASQHLAGDPHAPYSVQVMHGDSLYPSNYPANTYFQIKNKLGNPWDIRKYDNNYIYHWITENGDSVDNPLCQTANGSTCWLYARAFKRFLTPLKGWPRYLTPGDPPVVIPSPGPNTTNRTVDCEATLTKVITLGDVKTITYSPTKYTWGGSIDHGAGTGATGPTLDSVNGVDTIKNEYYYSGTIANDDFKDREEYYIVFGWGEVAWYYYHRTSATAPWTWVNQTVNSTLASGGAPAPNFPCGAGKPWWV